MALQNELALMLKVLQGMAGRHLGPTHPPICTVLHICSSSSPVSMLSTGHAQGPRATSFLLPLPIEDSWLPKSFYRLQPRPPAHKEPEVCCQGRLAYLTL